MLPKLGRSEADKIRFYNHRYPDQESTASVLSNGGAAGVTIFVITAEKMDIKNLYTLIAVANRASFASAAEALGLTVSTVSMQMRALEEELGTTLFDRSETLKREAAGGILKLGAVHSSDATLRRNMSFAVV